MGVVWAADAPILPLNLFPANGFDNSLLTAVLVGVLVRFIFTESVGWVFSGLVVPGYLAAVLLGRPVAGAVILVEACLTHLCVRSLSWFLGRTRLGTPFFGRDRFVWIVLVATLLRVLIEGLAAPGLIALSKLALGFDLSGGVGFFGVGLVLVPLAANAFWKPGLTRGAMQLSATTAITFGLLKVLMAVTNLSFDKMAFSFEHLALDLAASPKAYLLILVTALLASRANLRFGWDTSGVLIPGLLCLGWYSPIKLTSTLLEAVLIALLTAAFLRLPRVRNWNVEGPRRIVLVFTLGYFVKFALLLGWPFPSYTPQEIFGLGYLLPSLLAVKMWQKRNPALVLMPAVALSGAGLLVGSLLGFALLRGDLQLRAFSAGETLAQANEPTAPCPAPVPFGRAFLEGTTRVARRAPSANAPRIRPDEAERFGDLVRRLRQAGAAHGACAAIASNRLSALQLGLDLGRVQLPSGETDLVAFERAEKPTWYRGFGWVAVSLHPRANRALILERWEDGLEPALIGALATSLPADAIIINGVPKSSLLRGDLNRDRDLPVRAVIESLALSPLLVRAPSSGPSGPVGSTWAQALPPTSPALVQATGASPVEHASSLLDPVSPPQARPGQPWSGPLREVALSETLLRPLLRMARMPVDTDLARLSRIAQLLDFRLAVIDGPGAIRLTAQDGEDGRLIVIPENDGPLVEVRATAPGAPEFAAMLADVLRARALLLHGHSPGALTHTARALLALAPEQRDWIVVAAGDTQDAGNRVEANRPGESLQGNRAAVRLEAGLGALSIPFQEVDALPARIRSELSDALAEARPGPFARVMVDPATRERFRGAGSGGYQRLAQRLGISLVSAKLPALLSSACSAKRRDPGSWSEWRPEALGFGASRDPARLKRLSDLTARRHGRLALATSGLLGQTYLVAQAEGASIASALPGGAGTAVKLRCSARVEAAVDAALRSHAQSIEVERP